jgi:hypothetical protein
MSLILDGTIGVQGNSGAFIADTAKASTSGTTVDFTGIPSWVKRITVMFSGVSTNGTSGIRFRLMVGGVGVDTGYLAASVTLTSAVAAAPADVTDGFPLPVASASSVYHGQIIISKLSDSIYTASGTFFDNLATERISITTGRVQSISGAVDGVQITTTGGTNTFDAGTINILYE